MINIYAGKNKVAFDVLKSSKQWLTATEIAKAGKYKKDLTASLWHMFKAGFITRRKREKEHGMPFEYFFVTEFPKKAPKKARRAMDKPTGEDTLLNAAANYHEYRQALIEIRDKLIAMELD